MDGLVVTTGAPPIDPSIAKSRRWTDAKRRSKLLARSNVQTPGYAALVAQIFNKVEEVYLKDLCDGRATQYQVSKELLWPDVPDADTEEEEDDYGSDEDQRAEASHRRRSDNAFALERAAIRAAMPRKLMLRDALVRVASGRFVPQRTARNEGVIQGVSLSEAAAKDLATQYFDAKRSLPSRMAEAKKVERSTFREDEFYNNVTKDIDTDTIVNEALPVFWRLVKDDGLTSRVTVSIAVQRVEEGSYAPIADIVHMDPVLPRSNPTSVGETYGIAPGERDVQIAITSFCADELREEGAEGAVTLRDCGTVLYDGIPVVPPETLIEVAKELQDTATFDACTERELVATLSAALTSATSAALMEYTDEMLQSVGIVKRSMATGAWSFENALSFHRSPSREEVLETVTRDASGKARNSVRVFVALIAGDDGQLFLAERTYRTKSPNGHALDVRVALRTDVSVMGEDSAMGE